MALNLGKLINTVTKIANDPNAKKVATGAKSAVTGAKNAVTKMKQNKAQTAAVAQAATPSPEAVPAPAPAPEANLSPEKVILQLAEKTNPLTLKQIISQTSLELDEADEAVKHLVAKGVATEQAGPDGKAIYDFS
jgi:hypothetical protein